MNLFELTAFAEGTAAPVQGQPQGAAAMVASFLPFVLIIVVMYFLMIRPQKKKEKALREMINALKVGDKIVTIGGICGKVAKIKDEFVVIETGNIGTQAEKSFIKMEKASIKTVETKQSN